MKKYLLLGFALFSTLGFSQQGFGEIIINTTNNQIITRTWDVANGNSPTNVDGNKYFNNYNTGGTILIYFNDIIYEPNTNAENWGDTLQQTSENIGNGIASYNSPLTNINYGNFVNQNNNNDIISLVLVNKRDDGTINGTASSSPIEILRQEYTITNINSLPDGTWILVRGRGGNLSPAGIWNSFAMGTKKVNGIWIFPAVGPDETTPLPNVIGTQTLGGRVVTFNYSTDQQLSTNELDIVKNKISIFPNPTLNLFTIQSNENSTENFDYKIVDLTGRIVKCGNSKFNEQINLEGLESGNYIIKVQTDNNKFFTQKIIKN
jgi:hypothetical protein